MLRLPPAAFCAIALALAMDASATTVLRCEDPNGHVTFTLHGCSTDQRTLQQEASNARPGSGKPVPLAKPDARRQPAASGIRFAATGEPDDGCGNQISGRERRQATIRKQALAGMSTQDIESAFGKPQRISRSNGQTRYHYKDRDGNTRQVSFDERGCVKAKR